MPINAGLKSSTVGELEQQIWSSVRWRKLEPEFDDNSGPLLFSPETNTAFDGGAARTPSGLIVELNAANAEPGASPAGTWKVLRLAQSPQDAEAILSLLSGANPDPASQAVVNPTLSNTLQHSNLFLVVTDPPNSGSFRTRYRSKTAVLHRGSRLVTSRLILMLASNPTRPSSFSNSSRGSQSSS